MAAQSVNSEMRNRITGHLGFSESNSIWNPSVKLVQSAVGLGFGLFISAYMIDQH